jgi:5-methylcytosine-specific restriction endonuclease McrA
MVADLPREAMSLQTLKPRLGVLKANRVPMLDAKAGTTERMGGDAWMKIRRRVLLAGSYTCVDCGRVHHTNEIDHDVPLEQGGSHDDANLRIRCRECHKAKTAREQRARFGKT